MNSYECRICGNGKCLCKLKVPNGSVKPYNCPYGMGNGSDWKLIEPKEIKLPEKIDMEKILTSTEMAHTVNKILDYLKHKGV